MNKKILVITSCFAPKNVVGAIRITKLVKYLVRLGYDITVISPELDSFSKIDTSLLSDELLKVDQHTLAHGTLFTRLFLKKRNKMLQNQSASSYISYKEGTGFVKKIKTSLYSFLQFLYAIIKSLDWKREIIHFSKKQFQKNEFDIVLSSYPSLGDHWASNWLKKNSYASTWIADFRDPINYEVDASWLKIKVSTLFQDSILRNADVATCISKDLFKKFNPTYHYKLKYLPNGFDTDDLNNETLNKILIKNAHLTFCYVGSLYGGTRNFKSFFKALKVLIEKDLISKDKVELVYAGKEFNVLEQQASAYNLASILKNMGLVSRSESIRIQNNADMIIVVTWNTEKDQGILTGKLFECFLTQKPILGIVNGNVAKSEFKEIIHSVGGGFAFEDPALDYDKEFQHLLDFITFKYEEKQNLGYLENSYNSKLENYNYKNVTKSLTTFFN